MKEELLPLFPSTVKVMQERGPTIAELKFINSLERMDNLGNSSSVDKYVLEADELTSLKYVISEQIRVYFDEVYRPDDRVRLKITQSWCNFTQDKENHHQHNHPNSVVSGVYYPQSHHDEDAIDFHTPLMPYLQTKIIPVEKTILNTPICKVTVKTGMLVLFPSYLEHSVASISGRSSTRISLSFNTFYSGAIGHCEEATELFI